MRLRAVALRMLGSPGEAGGALQEARINLSRRTRRQEPLEAQDAARAAAGGIEPEAAAVLDDAVGQALLIVLAYCRGPYGAFAPEAVRRLRARGLQARPLEEGLREWAAARLPLESGVEPESSR